jgi:hypothetical protein
MATTTNYGFEIPDDTDLVKDGALAMRDLGQDVDTAMFAALNGEPARSVLLNSTAISNVSSITVNNVFNATYTNYQLLLNITSAATTNIELNFRIAASGTPVSTSTYGFAAGGADTAGNNSSAGSASATSIGLTFIGSPNTNAFANYTIANPFKTVATSIQGTWTYDDGSFLITRQMGGKQRGTTSYDGFNLFSSANFTGVVKIYGLKDS